MDILRNKFIGMQYDLPKIVVPSPVPDFLEQAVGEICKERAIESESS